MESDQIAGYPGGTWKPNVKSFLFPIFLPNSGAIACWVTELNAGFPLLPEREKENIRYFILEWGSNPEPAAFTVRRLCHRAGIETF